MLPTESPSGEWSRKSTFKTSATQDEMMDEIEGLHQDVERLENELRAATQETESLRKQVSQHEDGVAHFSRTSKGARRFDGEMATESEVRWGIFLTEKSRLQAEKGWRKALKESKKMLQDQLDESYAQTKARDREAAGLRARLASGAEEDSKRRQEADALRSKINQMQEALDSERQLRLQEQDKNAQLEEEFMALHSAKESHKMVDGRSKQRLVTHDLASQLSFQNDDFQEYDVQNCLSSESYDTQNRMSMSSESCTGSFPLDRSGSYPLDTLHEEDNSSPHHSERSSIYQRHDRQSVRQSVRSSIQGQNAHHSVQSVRKSIFLQREDELNRRLLTSEAQRHELEAQIVELQRQLQCPERNTRFIPSPKADEQELHSRLHASEAARAALEAQLADLQSQLKHVKHRAPSPVLPQVPEPECSGANNELWEECEELRNELAKISQAKEDAQWEVKEVQRRLYASEAHRRDLEVQVSDMQRQAQLAEKEFRAYQKSESLPWWSRLQCHCLQKRPEGGEQTLSAIATPASEQQLQLTKPPRAAIHMKPAKNSGASWLARPLG